MNSFQVSLIISIITYSLMGIYYYFIQNKNPRKGGPISIPKAIWLTLAMYHYFILGLFIMYIQIEDSIVFKYISVVLFISYSRALIQAGLMFAWKNWSPIFGILFNGVSALVIICFLVLSWWVDNRVYTQTEMVGLIYLGITVLYLIIDTYFAWSFYGVVGNATKGDEPIWYASSQNISFEKINKKTRVVNVCFLILLIMLLQLIYKI